MSTTTVDRSGATQIRGYVPEWELGDRLAKALRVADVGVQEIADRLGIARKTVNNYIAGRTTPTRSTVIAWALATGVDFTWLMHGEAPQPEGPAGGLWYTARDSNPEPADSVSATVYHLIPRMRYTDDDERHTA